MTTRVTAAYVSQTPIAPERLTDVISSVHQTLNDLASGAVPLLERGMRKPAIAIAKSVAPNYIVCLEDGRRMKMLKRHLKAAYGLSPEEYRQRWNLPADYPMVAPQYAAQRSKFAKQMGLGKNRKPRCDVSGGCPLGPNRGS